MDKIIYLNNTNEILVKGDIVEFNTHSGNVCIGKIDSVYASNWIHIIVNGNRSTTVAVDMISRVVTDEEAMVWKLRY